MWTGWTSLKSISAWKAPNFDNRNGGTCRGKQDRPPYKRGAHRRRHHPQEGEKKLVELYREADSDTRKKAVSVLKGEQTGVAGLIGGILGELDGVDLGGIADMLGKK